QLADQSGRKNPAPEESVAWPVHFHPSFICRFISLHDKIIIFPRMPTSAGVVGSWRKGHGRWTVLKGERLFETGVKIKTLKVREHEVMLYGRCRPMVHGIVMKIIRSKRRTVGLEINDRGELIIRAPEGLGQAAIDEIIERHRRWIDRKLAEVEKRRQMFRPKKFVEGERFLWLGQEYPLVISSESHPALKFNGREFVLSARWQGRAREIFKKLYRQKALAYLSHRTRQLAELNGFRFARFRLSSAKTRWGSCSARGTVSLTWRLIMAPPEIIDYVIIHELAHTREKNHSRNFWELVEEQLPDYRERRRWLKKFGFRLNL
ncbi:MAG: M48 family metallopeptidase, partial [Candidatus Saccharicenans sp.]|nr:M48 family metallopeptidase [Candidatus Saccharicenans sp.]